MKNDSHNQLVRSSTLLSALCAKNSFSVALTVVLDGNAIINAHAQNQLESFIREAVEVFIKLEKPQQAFTFLETVESRIY